MKTVLVAMSLLVGSSAFAAGKVETIASSKVSVNPARITDRVVLVNKPGNTGVVVQIIAQKTNGATDVSNTHELILSISQLGEETEKETSFKIGNSMGLTSAKRVSGGVYRLELNDAEALESGSLAVVKTIDARAAVNQIQNGQCEDWTTCIVKSSVEVETKSAK